MIKYYEKNILRHTYLHLQVFKICLNKKHIVNTFNYYNSEHLKITVKTALHLT